MLLNWGMLVILTTGHRGRVLYVPMNSIHLGQSPSRAILLFARDSLLKPKPGIPTAACEYASWETALRHPSIIFANTPKNHRVQGGGGKHILGKKCEYAALNRLLRQTSCRNIRCSSHFPLTGLRIRQLLAPSACDVANTLSLEARIRIRGGDPQFHVAVNSRRRGEEPKLEVEKKAMGKRYWLLFLSSVVRIRT